MRDRPSLAHRLRVRLQRWLDVPAHTAQDFGAVEPGAMVEAGVHFSDPSTVFLGSCCAVYRGCTVLTGPGVLRMGPRSHLASGVYVNALRAGVYIGSGTAIGPYSVLLSYSNAVLPGQSIDEARIESELRIGDDVFVGAGSVLLPGLTIGNGAVIAAGAVVRKDIQAGEVVGGVPARRLGTRP